MTVGFTMGCFDLFHVGHVNLLRNSRGMCDHLIVGVFTDNHVRLRKDRKTIIQEDDRISVVRACRYVSVAIAIDHADRSQLHAELGFDVLFVGDDWKGRIKETLFPVVYFPYTTNVSTTLIQEQIRYRE